MQSAAKRKQKLERMLEEAGFIGQFIHTATDEELRRVDGVGPAAVKEIRKFWPPPADQPPEEKPEPLPPVAVYDFGLKADSEKAKRAGLWHDMSAIAPERWGPVHLRLRSLESQVVIAAVDRIEAELLAEQPGTEVALGKVREEVNNDTGDRALSRAIIAASFGLFQRRTRQQELEYNWRRAVICIRGLRGTAIFGGQERAFTGHEPAEEIQKLLQPVLEISAEHAKDVMACVLEMAQLDHAEICRLGEDYAVTERPAAGLLGSVAKNLMAGRGR